MFNVCTLYSLPPSVPYAVVLLLHHLHGISPLEGWTGQQLFLVTIIVVVKFLCEYPPLCQGVSETGNVSCPSAHRTLTDLWNRRSRGRVPAECLEQKMRRKLSSHFAQVLLYI